MMIYSDTPRILGMVLSSIYLAGCAAEDFLTRRIHIASSVCAGAAALFLLLVRLAVADDPGKELCFALMALLPGIMLLFLAFAAKGAAGSGDGICYLVLGLFLGAGTAWLILMISLLMASAAGIVLLVLHKAGRKTRMPFLTVSAAAWALILVSGFFR